jgi:hypothetical protein
VPHQEERAPSLSTSLSSHAEQCLGIEQVLVELLDPGPRPWRLSVATQVDREQRNARRVEPPGKRLISSGVLGKAMD